VIADFMGRLTHTRFSAAADGEGVHRRMATGPESRTLNHTSHTLLMKTYIRLSGISRSTTAAASGHVWHDWPRYERQPYFSRPVKKEAVLDTAPPSGMSAGAIWRCCLSPVRLLCRALLVAAAAAALTGTAFALEENETLAVGAPLLSKDQLQMLVDRMMMRQNNGQAQPKAQRKTPKREQSKTQGSMNQMPMVDGAALTAALAEAMERRASAPSASSSGSSSGGVGAATVQPTNDGPAATMGSTGVGANGSSNAGASNSSAAADSNTNAPATPEKTTPVAAMPDMPDIQFTAVDGRKVDLASLRGKVVLIDFWATWCGPCMGEIPNVVNAYHKYHEQGFEVIGISFDTNKAALNRVTEDKGMPWPQYFDGKGWANDFGVKFGIHGIPTMWLIDAQGRIITKNARTDLAGQVAKALEGGKSDEGKSEEGKSEK
jgi:peroxiredoxin